MIPINSILNADSYKASHFLQYPPGTEYVSSYIEARGYSKDAPLGADIVFFGLQYFLETYLKIGIIKSDIDLADEMLSAHGVPFNREGWEYILKEHNGDFPISIEAVPEGKVYPSLTPLVQVVNTDPKVPWLTSYIETALLRSVWYPSTVATISREAKKHIAFAMDLSAGHRNGIEFKLHDFGARGVSSEESAGIGGCAHLVNFKGTDTMTALALARYHYQENMAGYSIPAAEHSTITVWGKDQEIAAYKNMLDQFSGENKLVAVVSDSYDLFNAVENIWGDTLHDRVVNNGGTVVIRPDSGNPSEIPIQVIEALGKKFGHTMNSQGYKVLPPYLRVIQGDGINLDMIRVILDNLIMYGWSAENIAFGMGGALLQQCNRDTFKFAMKASAARVNGEWRDVYKSPATDKNKVSKRGRQSNPDFREVWRNGHQLVKTSLAEIRENAAI